MNTLRTASLLLAATSLSGCFIAALVKQKEPDLQITNPLAGGTVDASKIEKAHSNADTYLGVPPGTTADEAHIVSLDAKELCIAVTIHEVGSIDLRTATPRLSATGTSVVTQARADLDPPRVRQMRGQVPKRVQVGMQTVCTQREGQACMAWGTQPVYRTDMVPGNVRVYESSGRYCFANDSLITTATKEMTFEVRLPRPTEGTVEEGGIEKFGQTDRRAKFRWGFTGGGSTGKSKS
jgi:hypothetical protein